MRDRIIRFTDNEHRWNSEDKREKRETTVDCRLTLNSSQICKHTHTHTPTVFICSPIHTTLTGSAETGQYNGEHLNTLTQPHTHASSLPCSLIHSKTQSSTAAPTGCLFRICTLKELVVTVHFHLSPTHTHTHTER